MTEEPQSGDRSPAGGESELIEAARRQADDARQAARGVHETATSPAGSPLVDAASLSHRPPPDSFPGFEIVREIHRGGQGVVYQAIQKATKRKVAIKVMHEGPFAGARDKARFEREVQILAALKHPNIVGIHDSGVAGGSFYYVMDYISGQALDQYMASRANPPSPLLTRGGMGGFSIDETLKLFAKICEVVNSAHLKGVIHRDLKPGNIRIDSSGEPHVLDFGLAKLATGEVTDASRPQIMTMTGQFIGSMPWASPEQAEGVPDKIDIRTDVYSLGVVLYQMLTGRFPYEVVGNMRDVLDNILRVEPTKPSTVRRQINDEVETIVLKCLQKERERRYQSAGELARDIGHYLAGEPIEAKRDSAMYVLRKQLRRYKFPVAVAALFVILLGASTIALSVMFRNQSRERQRAEEQTRIAQLERDRAVAAEERQSRERERADAERDAVFAAALSAPVPQDETERRYGLDQDADAASERITAELFDRLVFVKRVLEHLRSDSSLDPFVRYLAIARAQRMGDEPERLHAFAWKTVSKPGADAERRTLAMWAAKSAARQRPNDGDLLTTLGVARYRVGRYDEALDTLTRADAQNRRNPSSSRPADSPDTGAGHPADIAFMAMSLHKLGRADGARAALQRLRGLMQDPRYVNDVESQGFLREAETLISGAPTSQPQQAEGLSQP